MTHQKYTKDGSSKVQHNFELDYNCSVKLTSMPTPKIEQVNGTSEIRIDPSDQIESRTTGWRVAEPMTIWVRVGFIGLSIKVKQS